MALLPALAIVGLGGSEFYRWACATPRFVVERISIAEMKYIDAGEIAAGLDSVINRNIIGLNLKRLEAALETMPYIDEVRIYRSFPSELRVSVKERDILAMLNTDRGLTTVDFNGEIVAPPRPGDVFDFPLLSECAPGSEGFRCGIEFLRAARTYCPRVYAQISEVIYNMDKSEITALVGEKALPVIIGRGAYWEKILALWALLEKSPVKLKEIAEADLRFPQRIYFKRG